MKLIKKQKMYCKKISNLSKFDTIEHKLGKVIQKDAINLSKSDAVGHRAGEFLWKDIKRWSN